MFGFHKMDIYANDDPINISIYTKKYFNSYIKIKKNKKWTVKITKNIIIERRVYKYMELKNEGFFNKSLVVILYFSLNLLIYWWNLKPSFINWIFAWHI